MGTTKIVETLSRGWLTRQDWGFRTVPISSGGGLELYLPPRWSLLHSRAVLALPPGVEGIFSPAVFSPSASEARQMHSVSLFSSGARVGLFSPFVLLGPAFPELGVFPTLVLGSVGQVPLVFPLHCVCLQGSLLRSLDLELSPLLSRTFCGYLGVPNRALVGLTPELVSSQKGRRWGQHRATIVRPCGGLQRSYL